MKLKKFLRRMAKFILNSSSDKKVFVNVNQVNYNEQLKDRNIIITGGSRGIGLSIAKKCISEGANVIITGRNKKTLIEASKELGKNSKYIVFDSTNISKIPNFFIDAKNLFNGEIDSLICNAGISMHENIYKNVTEESFDKQFDINFKSNYFLSKYFLEYLENNKAKSGNLIFISSETGNQCYDIPYGLTKASLNSLTRALSRRVYKDNIRVNAIAPGVTKSDMTREYAEAEDGNLYRNCSSDRIFLPEEIAEVACFLLSDSSKCISGEIIHCNAGNHLSVFWDE